MWDTIATLCTGVLIGFASLFAIVAYCIKKDDKTPLRKTAGGFLQELGTIISNSTAHKNPNN